MGVISCVSCGEVVNDEASACPECGRDPRTGEEKPRFDGIAVGLACYLGGNPGLGEPRTDMLYLAPEWIGHGEVGESGVIEPGMASMSLSSVVSIEVTGCEVAKRKIAAVLAFGVLGGLAAKGSMERAYLVVHTADGHDAFFQMDGTSDMALRARIGHRIKAAGVPFSDDLDAANPASKDISDQLAQLARLHRRGDLTDDEFAAAKAKILEG